jgi:hypothetical protein
MLFRNCEHLSLLIITVYIAFSVFSYEIIDETKIFVSTMFIVTG